MHLKYLLQVNDINKEYLDVITVRHAYEKEIFVRECFLFEHAENRYRM